MNLSDFFKKFQMNSIKIGPRWASVDISFEDADKEAAWELYIEMLTRIVTQPIRPGTGDEKTALESVYSLFSTTREILRQYGRKTTQLSKIAIPILNQVVRPFTAKWHGMYLSGSFNNPLILKEFRDELTILHLSLRGYNRMLADIAGVEDLTDLEVP